MKEFLHPIRKVALATGIVLGSLAAPVAVASADQAPQARTVHVSEAEREHTNAEEILEWKVAGKQKVRWLNGDLVIPTEGIPAGVRINEPLMTLPETNTPAQNRDLIGAKFYRLRYDPNTKLPVVREITENKEARYIELAQDGSGTGFPSQGPSIESVLELGYDGGALGISTNFGEAATVNGHPAFIDYDGYPTERTHGSDGYIIGVQSSMPQVYKVDYTIPGSQHGATVIIGNEFEYNIPK